MRAALGAIAIAALAGQARARPIQVTLLPRLSGQTIEQAAPAPTLRPAAIGSFVASGLALGASVYFGVQSNNFRSEYLAAVGPPAKAGYPTMNSWYQSSVQNGEIAVGLLGGAAAFAALGAGLWWYGSRVAVVAGPGGVGVAGAFP